MKTGYSPLIRVWVIHFAVMIVMLLSACDPRDTRLSEREASISARESELVTLFAELIEQRKSLEQNQAARSGSAGSNADSQKNNQCTCEAVQSGSAALAEKRTLLGGLENVYLDPPGMEFSARIDTGAQTSSLNAIDIVEFERDGKPFVRFSIFHPQTGEKLEVTRRLRKHVKVKERGDRESHRRPVVRMRVVVADIDEQVNFTLIDRGKFWHQVLIGRNLLRDLAIVDVSKKFTAVKTDNPAAGETK